MNASRRTLNERSEPKGGVKETNRPCYVYIIECEGGWLYTGASEDVTRRFNEHKAGGSRFTKAYQAERVIYTEQFPNRSGAEERERQIKGWTRAKKLALAASDFALLKSL